MCEEILTEKYPVCSLSLAPVSGASCTNIDLYGWQPMFPDDPGSEEMRATVHGWALRRGPRNQGETGH